MTRAELDELREAWGFVVVFGEQHETPWLNARPPRPCWFGENASDPHECSGRIEGAHWIKRQTVERTIAQQLELPEIVTSPKWQRRWRVFPQEYVDAGLEFVFLAAWDPRLGVPACRHHHDLLDDRKVPLPSKRIVVWRHDVPAHVEAFARDWGLEHELERKHDTIGGGI